MRKTLFLVILLTAGFLGWATRAHAVQLDLSLVTASGSIDEAMFSRTAIKGQGSGNFDSFLRIQETPTEKGYNTNGALEFDTKAGAHTHAIEISGIPIFPILGTDYYEFAVDAAEPAGNSLVIDVIEIYLLGSPTITNYAANIQGSGGLKYQLDKNSNDNSILLDNVTGNGVADLFIYVPVSNFTGTDTWVYFYTDMSQTAGSFEEVGRRVGLGPGSGCTANCTVPEPTSMFLFGAGLVGAYLRRRF